jgi:hypothetical protein
LEWLFAPQAVPRVPVQSVDMARNAQLTEQLLAAGAAADVAGAYGAAGAGAATPAASAPKLSSSPCASLSWQ